MVDPRHQRDDQPCPLCLRVVSFGQCTKEMISPVRPACVSSLLGSSVGADLQEAKGVRKEEAAVVVEIVSDEPVGDRCLWIMGRSTSNPQSGSSRHH